MTDSLLSNAGQASAESALATIEDGVRAFVADWEDSDDLPSDLARKIVRFVLRQECLKKAVAELEHLVR